MPVRKYYRTTISQKQGKRKGIRKVISIVMKTAGILLAVLFLFGIGVFAFYASQLPNPEEFEERIVEESTKIYDRTGSYLLYESGKDIKRTVIALDEISSHLQKATLAAEDDNFYNHPGIDIKSIARALIFDIFKGKNGSVQGGSTITQQFIKNAMFLETNNEGKVVGPAPRTISRKIQEAIMTFELERKYSKDEILEFYLNQVPFGSIFYGAEAASQNYFQKPAKDLTLNEATILASIIRSPTYYLKNPEEIDTRKNWILNRMVELDLAKKEEVEKAKKEEVALKIEPAEMQAPYFTQEVEQQLEDLYGENYQRMGFKVYTTIDLDLQTLAEKTVSEWSSKIEKWYNGKNAALVSINPNNGEILAMVGGRNFEESQVNIWTPKTKLSFQSPGSAFKPIVYATALKKGYTPDTILWDVKTVFDESKPDWPENYDFKQRGPVKIKEALAQSLNIPAVKALYLAGVNETANTARGMGMIDSFDKKIDNTDLNLSMAIGGKDIVPIELVSAFGVFATEGIRYLPHYISKIENTKGEIIYQPEPHPIKALNTEVCRQINQILSNNKLRTPTFGSKSWLNLGSYVAVKTGTSTNNKGKVIDAWTIGFTKNLVTGVWVGNNKNEPMKGKISGSAGAAPIWNNFMKEAIKDEPRQNFTLPKEVKTNKFFLDGYSAKSTVKIDKISGKLATNMTPADLIEEKEFLQPHSILYYIDKNDPRGDILENPFTDPYCEKWETGVQKWVKGTKGKYSIPTEKDDVHTEENKPKINITSKTIIPVKKDEEGKITESGKINFSIEIIASKGVKKIEVLFDNKPIENLDTQDTKLSFSYTIEENGFQEKENYSFKIKVTDKVENKSETTFTIENETLQSN